ncbi:hypothetical protein MHYP_G00170170 [Metynnis hypsauchen]
METWMNGDFPNRALELEGCSAFRADKVDTRPSDTSTSAVMSYINSCTDIATSVKWLRIFPNQKPWMNVEVRLLLKAYHAAFRSGDAEAYSSARADLYFQRCCEGQPFQ